VTRQEWTNDVRHPHSPLTKTQRYVALLLATHVDTSSLAGWPSLSLLAAESKMHRTTICRALDVLEGYRYIDRERGGPGRSTRYTLTTNVWREG
jgi:DNA-binding MarR family transcriptional regulator